MESLTIVFPLQCPTCEGEQTFSGPLIIAQAPEGATLIAHCTRCRANVGWDLYHIELQYYREVDIPPNDPATN
jgi:hypothetical protein